ncbi:ATP-binding protein [Patescibacteria group bacterium]|nr:ATP-binding protein [Patescibacteria group bacterium]
MIYTRKLFQQLAEEINSREITVLTGMRQVGKTTLMRSVFDCIKSGNKVFLDLENPLNQKIFEEEDFDNILVNLEGFGIDVENKAYIFLDEIQLVPSLVKAIKYLYDHYQIKFFLTGSSSFYLKNIFPESLAGRKIIYELFPLNFEEFLIFKKKEKKFFGEFVQKAKKKNKISFERYKRLYDEYLEFGGFPAVIIEKNRKRKISIIEDIFKSYFEKDVKTLADFKEISKLRDLILLLTARVSSKIEITKIASELGISRETVYSYLGFLEKTYFIFLLAPYSRSVDSEVRGAKKVYFCDTGLLNYLGRVPTGTIFENAVFQRLRSCGDLNYYQKYKGPEIDFILNKKIAFEAKVYGDANDLKKLQKLSENIKLKDYYLTTKNYLSHKKAIVGLDL